MKKEQEGDGNGRLQLGTALAQFQANSGAATKDSDQSFYKKADGTASKYADHNSIIEATQEPMAAAGLAFNVIPDFTVEKLKAVKTTTYPDGRVEVVEKEEIQIIEFTRGILWAGEHCLEGRLTVKTGARGDNDPQATGKGTTYNRRQLQTAMMNIRLADGEDDDGESVIGVKEVKSRSRKAKPSAPARPEMNRTEGERVLI